MSVKEQLVEIIQSQGYDLFTACELADTIIREMKEEKGKKKRTYYLKGEYSTIAITLQSKG